MTDLISREALLEDLRLDLLIKGELNYDEVKDLITNAPAIERGEAVIDKAAYDGAREDLSIWKRRALEAEEKVRKYDQRIVDIGVIAMTPVTTPQQPQSVADALEELERALCLIGVVGNVDGHDVIRRDSVINVARQRIKRNAKEGE